MLALVGPTGVGKSEVALEIARQVPSSAGGGCASGAEIVVVDSMQVYRGMDIGTGKPPRAVWEEIPHHGIDLVEPQEDFNVGRYVREMRPVIEAIRNRGRLPLLVGGSGLYLKALLSGLCAAPGEFPEIRQTLLEEAKQEGKEFLYARLRAVDSVSAAKIHPNDLKKMVRALEVFLATGKPLSQWQKEDPSRSPLQGECLLVGLTQVRRTLYRRIEERIDRWLADGWLEEARGLLKRPLSKTAREAIGYRELFSYLEGKCDWKESVAQIKQNSRRYAKRQWTWFRRMIPRVHWISIDGKTPL